jgi:CheY-like chemotaxis protein
MDTIWQVLVASSDLERRQRIAEILEKQDLEPICASTMGESCEILAHHNVKLAFCDRNFTDGDYRDLLVVAACKSPIDKVPIVLISSAVDPEEYRVAKVAGLFAVIASPCRPTDVEWMAILASRSERNRAEHLLGSSI